MGTLFVVCLIVAMLSFALGGGLLAFSAAEGNPRTALAGVLTWALMALCVVGGVWSNNTVWKQQREACAVSAGEAPSHVEHGGAGGGDEEQCFIKKGGDWVIVKGW